MAVPKGFSIKLGCLPRSPYKNKPNKDPGNKLNIIRNNSKKYSYYPYIQYL